jgi:hypothetical protein
MYLDCAHITVGDDSSLKVEFCNMQDVQFGMDRRIFDVFVAFSVQYFIKIAKNRISHV